MVVMRRDQHKPACQARSKSCGRRGRVHEGDGIAAMRLLLNGNVVRCDSLILFGLLLLRIWPPSASGSASVTASRLLTSRAVFASTPPDCTHSKITFAHLAPAVAWLAMVWLPSVVHRVGWIEDWVFAHLEVCARDFFMWRPTRA